MRRGIRHSGKSYQSHDESDRQCESVSADSFSTKNVKRHGGAVTDKARSMSVLGLLKESKDGLNLFNTGSPFPTPRANVVKLPLRKFYKLYSKIVTQLETVKAFAETKRNESNNLVDLRRQLQRADEFSIRFSRNNLYETKRIINEIKQVITPSLFDNASPGNSRLLLRKIVLAYQAASQSLQSYINYAKNPSNLEVPHKVNELVLLIADLFLCCEHVSLPVNDACLKNDAVKVCNDLIKILKSKLPVCEYVEAKEGELAKNRSKKLGDEGPKVKKLSMYKSKLAPKLKMEVLRKKHGIACLLGAKARKSRKDEKKAKITHDIYTQKLNHWKGKGSKLVKFEGENVERLGENVDEKSYARRQRHLTPREVRSRDDDVVTMVQAIGDDETSTCRLNSTPKENDEDGDLNQGCIKELLLEAIEDLCNSDKKEQKITLRKLLSKIGSCSRTQNEVPASSERVKVFHFLSKDLLEEAHDRKPQEEDDGGEQNSDSPGEEQGPPSKREVLPSERKLKMLFKPLVERRDVRSVESNGAVKLKLSEETMRNAVKDRKAFSEYKKNNIMYTKTIANKPWKLVANVSDRIILDIIKEISLDFENDAILRRLYLSELQEVTS